MMEWPLNGHGVTEVRLTFTCYQDHRIWLDGEYLHGSQATNLMFPSPHAAQIGHFVDFTLPPGQHRLSVALSRPKKDDGVAEWSLALAENPSHEWIPNAFRASGDSSAITPGTSNTDTSNTDTTTKE